MNCVKDDLTAMLKLTGKFKHLPFDHTQKVHTSVSNLKIHKLTFDYKLFNGAYKFNKDWENRFIYYTITKPKTKRQVESIIIYAKGRGWDLGMFHKSLAQKLADYTNSIVVCFEYPGYGVESPKNIHPVLAYLYMAQVVAHFKNKQIPIIMYGFSLGCAVALRALCVIKSVYSDVYDVVKGCILQSAFSSLTKVVGDSPFEDEVIKKIPKRLYDNKAVLASGAIDKPIGFLHGHKDATCPIHRAFVLYKLYPKAVDFKYISDAGHNDLHDNELFKEYVVDLCKQLLANHVKYTRAR